MKVSVHVHPGSRRPGVGGSHGGALVVRVSERAVDGRATQAVSDALAEAFGVPRSSVTLNYGATSRTKVYEVVDGDHDALAALLAL